jgi:NitT/TauT family transport system permease protein
VAALGLYLAHALAPFEREVAIDLSLTALPRYALYSFTRVCISYALSLVYTVVYGTIAAKNARAERVMIPVLDVLQGIPVLGFLPGIVLSMIALFPGSNLGLELACILMIFTAMPWNMAYSYYASLRALPEELSSVARVNRFTWWQRFRHLELPASAVGLVWNSMMSMAGGWFFLMIEEQFELEHVGYRLPGIGSYMAVAYHAGNGSAIVAALVTMTLVVVLSDQLIWKTAVLWAQRYKLDEDAQIGTPSSWLARTFARSRIVHALRPRKLPVVDLGPDDVARAFARPVPPPPEPVVLTEEARRRIRGVVSWVAGLALFALLGSGAVLIVTRLLVHVSLAQWAEILWGLLVTSLRVAAAVALGAAWTLPVGVAIGLSPRLSRWAQPIVQVVASFPAPMFFPLLAVLIVDRLGIPFPYGCVLLTLFGTQWYVLFNVIAGASAIPSDFVEAARVYRYTGLGRWRTLLLPGIVPHLLTGVFTAVGGAWNAAIVTEWQRVEGGRLLYATGLGSLIAQATEKGDYPLLAAAVLALVLTLVLLNRFVWARLQRYAEERFALAS